VVAELLLLLLLRWFSLFAPASTPPLRCPGSAFSACATFLSRLQRTLQGRGLTTQAKAVKMLQ
jgi:hypothetical protein